MLFLADENFPGEAEKSLRELGPDVASVRAETPGATDKAVLQRAQVETRIVLTVDKDLGELAFRFGLPASSGIIRIAAPSSREFARTAIRAL